MLKVCVWFLLQGKMSTPNPTNPTETYDRLVVYFPAAKKPERRFQSVRTSGGKDPVGKEFPFSVHDKLSEQSRLIRCKINYAGKDYEAYAFCRIHRSKLTAI